MSRAATVQCARPHAIVIQRAKLKEINGGKPALMIIQGHQKPWGFTTVNTNITDPANFSVS